MINEIQEFSYLQENPTYQADWRAAYDQDHTDLTLSEIKHFVESPRGSALAQRYGLVLAYYYDMPLADQFKAVNQSDLNKAAAIFLPERLYWTVRPISHPPLRVGDHLQSGYQLRDDRYLTVEIDIIRSNHEINKELKAILEYYRDQIGPGLSVHGEWRGH
jgi:hypothetical protein